jgi:hypothetical protein
VPIEISDRLAHTLAAIAHNADAWPDDVKHSISDEDRRNAEDWAELVLARDEAPPSSEERERELVREHMELVLRGASTDGRRLGWLPLLNLISALRDERDRLLGALTRIDSMTRNRSYSPNGTMSAGWHEHPAQIAAEAIKPTMPRIPTAERVIMQLQQQIRDLQDEPGLEARCERVDGEIETLKRRIASIEQRSLVTIEQRVMHVHQLIAVLRAEVEQHPAIPLLCRAIDAIADGAPPAVVPRV